MNTLTVAETKLIAGALADQMVRLGIEPGSFVGIPRGGVSAALLLAHEFSMSPVVVASSDERETVLDLPRPRYLIDDITTTGQTITRTLQAYPQGTFDRCATLIGKDPFKLSGMISVGQRVANDHWVKFPWEESTETGPDDAVRRLIEYMGDDPTREGVKDTPRRVLAFLDEWRTASSETFMATTFPSKHGDLVIVRDVPLFSLCEHHMLPYYGRASIGYIPQGKIIGLSKIPRLVRKLETRLSVQEELTGNIANELAFLVNTGKTPDVAVVTACIHTCMAMRGPRAHGTETITSAMLGRFRTSDALRAEFMGLARMGG